MDQEQIIALIHEQVGSVLTADDVRQILRDELRHFLGSSKFIFEKDIQIINGRDIQVGKGTGTRIGTESTQKLAVYGATPIVQQAAISNVLGGVTVDSEARTIINQVKTAIKNFGIIA